KLESSTKRATRPGTVLPFKISTFPLQSIGPPSRGSLPPSLGGPSLGGPSLGRPSFGGPSFGTPSVMGVSLGGASLGLPALGSVSGPFARPPGFSGERSRAGRRTARTTPSASTPPPIPAHSGQFTGAARS